MFTTRLPTLFALVLLGCVVATTAAGTTPGAPAATSQPKKYPTDDINRDILLPTGPGDHKLKFRTHVDGRAVDMSYLLHLPPHYNDDPHKRHPMLVFMHGIGECGTDLAGIYALGPMTMLKADGGNAAFAASCPFIVLCPQCPPRGQTWDTDYMIKATAELIDLTIKRTRTDPDRVSVTGLSMGGLGSWCVAEQMPGTFAAVAPLSAMAWRPETAAAKLQDTFVWAVTGLRDDNRFVDGARQMEAALANDPVTPRFSFFLEKGHDAWYPPYQSVGFYEWLLDHRRPDPGQRKKIDAGEAIGPPLDVPTAPGHYLLQFDVNIGPQPFHLDYLLYLPKSYVPATPVPALLALNELETIGPEYQGLCMHGPDMMLEKHPALQSDFEFAVISPRAPIDCDWDTPGMTRALLALLDHVRSAVNLDPARIAVTGTNAGAVGALKLAAEAPDHFSAVVPLFTAPGYNPDGQANAIKKLPGRMYVRGTDAAAVDRATQMLKKTKTDWKLIKIADDVSPTADLPPYSDRTLLNWLAGQRKAGVPISRAN